MLKSLPRPGFWLAVALCAIGVGLQMIFAVPLGVLDALYPKLLHQPSPELIGHPLGLAFVNICAFGVAVVIGLLLNRVAFQQAFPLTGVRLGRLFSILLLVVGMALMLSELDNLMRWLIPLPRFLQDLYEQLKFDRGHWTARFFLLVIVAPVTEELLFRGIILRGLLRHYRPWVAIALSSLLFGVVHLNPWQLVSASLLGLAFGWIYYRTGSIALCMFAHGVANGLVLLTSYLPIDIPGLTGSPEFGVAEFQPWWLDLTGLVLILLGAAVFRSFSRFAFSSNPEPPPVIPPPIHPAE